MPAPVSTNPVSTDTVSGDAPLQTQTAGAVEESFLLRLATNPAVDVEKLQAILAMQKDVKAQQATAAFNRAFATMQPLLPVIAETAHTDKTTYAPLEDIVEQVRPICAEHGFSFGWASSFPSDGQIRVVCTLTHVEGHERTSEFLALPDQTGSKNAIQARASAVSYGQRYTLNSLLGIVTRKMDDDGERAADRPGRKPAPDRPHDYQDKFDDLSAVADEGLAALEAAWTKLPEQYRLYINAMDRKKWEAIKTKAAQVGRGTRKR
jgi:hypothetical protein